MKNNWLADERTRWRVWRNGIGEIQLRVFMDGMIRERKQLMENAVMHRQPAQLSERWRDVIRFSPSRHDHSSWVLDWPQSLDLRLWQSNLETTANVILYLYYRVLCSTTCLCCCKRRCFGVPLHVLKLMSLISVMLNCPVWDDLSFF